MSQPKEVGQFLITDRKICACWPVHGGGGGGAGRSGVGVVGRKGK